MNKGEYHRPVVFFLFGIWILTCWLVKNETQEHKNLEFKYEKLNQAAQHLRHVNDSLQQIKK